MAVADEATNSIIVDADPDAFQAVLGLIASLDRPKPRIQVDVTVYEITNPSRLRLGVDWFLPVLEPNSDGTGSVMTIASNPSGGGLRGEIGEDLTFFGRVSRDPLLIPFTDAMGNVVDVLLPRETAVVTAESREVTTRALMQPSLLMTSGDEQRLFAGQNVPIPVAQPSETLSGTQTATRVERQDVGVELRATARTGQEGKVHLDLLIEISRVSLSPVGSIAQVGPTLDERRVETSLSLADGELAVIGMSQDSQQVKSNRGTPFLQDIPVLGYLMRSGGKTQVDNHLVFAVQARVLKTREEDLAESLLQRLALERRLSRVRGIRRTSQAPYAVLVTTRSDGDAARTLADSFERDGLRAQVGVWEDSSGRPRYDVYLTGYGQMADAGFDAFHLQDRGFRPQVVVLPGELAVAKTPGLRLLGSPGTLPEPLQ
jgi:general secretion pathway protein D